MLPVYISFCHLFQEIEGQVLLRSVACVYFFLSSLSRDRRAYAFKKCCLYVFSCRLFQEMKEQVLLRSAACIYLFLSSLSRDERAGAFSEVVACIFRWTVSMFLSKLFEKN